MEKTNPSVLLAWKKILGSIDQKIKAMLGFGKFVGKKLEGKKNMRKFKKKFLIWLCMEKLREVKL